MFECSVSSDAEACLIILQSTQMTTSFYDDVSAGTNHCRILDSITEINLVETNHWKQQRHNETLI